MCFRDVNTFFSLVNIIVYNYSTILLLLLIFLSNRLMSLYCSVMYYIEHYDWLDDMVLQLSYIPTPNYTT